MAPSVCDGAGLCSRAFIERIASTRRRFLSLTKVSRKLSYDAGQERSGVTNVGVQALFAEAAPPMQRVAGITKCFTAVADVEKIA